MYMVILLMLLTSTCVFGNPCNSRVTPNGLVCICNATYCDTVPELGNLHDGSFKKYSTNDRTLGYTVTNGSFSRKMGSAKKLSVLNKYRHQIILGFGGAFTDATGMNINSLQTQVRNRLLESYFGQSGIEYSLCRVVIGGADFSPRPYSYDDHKGDLALKYFKLQSEDFAYKIPFIKQAISLKKEKPLKLFATAWTAPPWMKTSYIWTGYSMLKEKYYQLWANYLLRFFDEYKKQNIDFWGLTTGNEPLDGFYSPSYSTINSMGWIPHLQNKWIKENLGPTFRNSTHNNLKIIIHDDDRITIPHVVPLMLEDNETLHYIDGVGIHWYWDDSVPPEIMSLAKTDKKSVFLLMTEACVFREGVSLGSWSRGALYAASIIEYLNFGAVGWIDWNMALNPGGGPTYINFFADSPIIVNGSAQEFYKQPLFYVMGHFSKFLVPGSIRIELDNTGLEDKNIKTVAVVRPDHLKVVIIFNNGTRDVDLQIEDDGLYSDIFTVSGNSINTLVYKGYAHDKES